MAEKTKIAWCDSTWNFAINCDRVSAGCANCYIEKSPPLRWRGLKLGGPIVELSEGNWKKPFAWNKKPWVCDVCGKAYSHPQQHECPTISSVLAFPDETNWHRRRIFCQSLGDWLNPRIPMPVLARMLDTVRQCDQVDWLLCTKRPELWLERIADMHFLRMNGDGGLGDWLLRWRDGQPPKNVWFLVTAENQKMLEKRAEEYLTIPAVVRGISAEPLLGPLDFEGDVAGIADWVIVGGESGKNARPCNIEWIRSIKEQCEGAHVPGFVKQAGLNCICTNIANDIRQFPDWRECVHRVMDHCRVDFKHPNGGDPAEWPADLRVRQFPQTRR